IFVEPSYCDFRNYLGQQYIKINRNEYISLYQYVAIDIHSQLCNKFIKRNLGLNSKVSHVKIL
ncbi:MAG: hypothetical protein MJ211_05715, partial [Bacteroidales bacterium]|nr:hypothetical protein [Bacteroidales bacterium]